MFARVEKTSILMHADGNRFKLIVPAIINAQSLLNHIAASVQADPEHQRPTSLIA